MIKAPDIIEKRKTELDELIKEHPKAIPVPTLARFLGIDPTALRHSIMQGKSPFGMTYKLMGRTNNQFTVPTLQFYLWYTQGNVEF